jgi:hypothetical protein
VPDPRPRVRLGSGNPTSSARVLVTSSLVMPRDAEASGYLERDPPPRSSAACSRPQAAFSLLAYSNSIPPYWDRQRSKVDSLNSKAYNTAGISLPAFSIDSASRSLATISSGRGFFRRLVVLESLLTLWAVDLHTGWIRISKAGQLRKAKAARPKAREIPLPGWGRPYRRPPQRWPSASARTLRQ